MAMLEPKLAILDETDSRFGNIDALRIVANGVNKLKSKSTTQSLLITQLPNVFIGI